MIQYTWVVTTDVLWPSSTFRRTKANLVTPRRQSVNEKEKRAKMEMNRNTDLEQEFKEAEPDTSKESTTKEATEAKVKAMEQKSEAEEDAAPAASAASPASTAAADGQSITKAHAAAFEGTVASEAQETTEKDEKNRALIQKKTRRRSMKKDESVNSAKRSKNVSEKTKG